MWRIRSSEERKRVGWKTWVRMGKIIAPFLHEAHERQAGGAMGALDQGPEGFYESRPDRPHEP